MILPKRVLFLVLLIGCAFLVGFIVARRTIPTKIVTQTQTLTVTKEVVKWRTRVIRNTHEYQTVVTHKFPDGTEVTKRTDEHDTTTKTHTTKANTENSSTNQSSQTTTVYSRPNWRVGALVSTELRLPIVPEFGGSIERRIVGPFWIGIHGYPTGKRFGASLAFEF